MAEHLSSKRYEPPRIDLENKNSSQTRSIELIGSHKKILELGTSTGYVSKILKDHGNIVTGIEIDQEAGSIAEQYCDQLIFGDVEELDFDTFFEPQSYDIILCGDILEHLKNPAALLKKIKKYLKPEGYLVVSLPNFCHGDVLLNLLNGDFHYTSMGLLDETHLHFFGLKNIYSVFADCGYQIKDLHTTNLNIGTTELKIDENKIPRDLLKFIQSLPNSTVYQYIFRAYPSDNTSQPYLEETDITTLFFDSLKESRQELILPLEEKIAHLQERTNRIDELEHSVASGMEQMAEMTNTIHLLQQGLSLTSKDQQFEEVSIKAEFLEQQLSKKNSQLEEINSSTKTLAKTLSLKEIQLQALTTRLNDQEQKLSAIETSIIWQLTMKFHYKVVEKILPLNTRRRRYYDLGRAGGRILVNEGYPAFRQAVERYFHNGISSSDYQKWIIKNEPTLTELKRLKELSQNFSYRPKISIVTPVWNTDKKWLRAAIDSVIHQSYDNWELCIVDGGSTKRHISKILDEYSKKDSRIKVKILKENRGIAGNSNEALSLATGEFIGFLDHDDELAPFALYEIVKLLNQNQNADFIYSDEDKIDSSGKRKDPFFKPDWSPDLFLSCNYVCHFSVARKVLLDSVGGFRQGYDGSQDYDLFLRVTEQCPKTGILHIPKILYHWRMIPQSAASSSGAKPYAYDAAKRALSDAMSRRNIPIEGICDGYGRGYYKIKYKLIGTPQVSIIIPTKNNGISLSRCIASVIQKTTFSNFEILIVDNESSEKKTLDYYTQIQPDHQVKVLRYPQSFNISAMYNFAVSRTKAPYLIFLKDNAENITDDWITQMLNYAQQEDIGIVGGKICYPNNTIDSAGYILGITPKECGERMFGSAHKNFPSNHPGYFQFIQTVRNVSAISGICMMVKREAFMKAGGFDERLTQTGYDVDICLKIQNRGYSIIYSPYLQIYHHPEQYNNKQEESQKRREVLTELKYVGKKWASIINKGDPYYNPNLSLRCEDFSIQI